MQPWVLAQRGPGRAGQGEGQLQSQVRGKKPEAVMVSKTVCFPTQRTQQESYLTTQDLVEGIRTMAGEAGFPWGAENTLPLLPFNGNE